LIYSTVSECVIYDVNLDNVLKINSLNEMILKFDVSIKNSKLTKTYHYNSKQQELYDVIKKLYEVKGYGYRRISDILINDGYRTIRSNKSILPNYVHSIYKKGKIRENRINREFDSYLHNIKLFRN